MAVRTANTKANGIGVAREVAHTVDCVNGQAVATGREADNLQGADCGMCKEMTTYSLDQQGGKGMVGNSREVMPVICSDSHGTPHAVAQVMLNSNGGHCAATLDCRLAAGVNAQMERGGGGTSCSYCFELTDGARECIGCISALRARDWMVWNER